MSFMYQLDSGITISVETQPIVGTRV